MIGRDQIQKRVEELGREITEDFQGREIDVVGVLNGAFIFLADLVRQLPYTCKVHLVRAKSYRATSQSETIDLEALPDLKGREVLLVEDILDSGKTLSVIMDKINQMNPKSLKTCVLLEKTGPDREVLRADFRGFLVEDVWVVGYGLDMDENYRNLPYIAELV